MDKKFNPFDELGITAPEQSQRVQNEVIHVDADKSESDDEEEELSEEEREEQEREERRAARERKISWQIISGNWLILEGITGTYRYLLIIAATLFLSVVSIFYSFHLGEKYTHRVSSVQLLRERSLEYQQARFNSTSHSAITKELKQRNIPLYDLQESKTIIEK